MLARSPLTFEFGFTSGDRKAPSTAVSLGSSAMGWLGAEIQEWLQRRIEASRKNEA